jgi:hypothetical protein
MAAVLRHLADGNPRRWFELDRGVVARHLGKEVASSADGKPSFSSRMRKARRHLVRAGLAVVTPPNLLQITDEGKKLVTSDPRDDSKIHAVYPVLMQTLREIRTSDQAVAPEVQNSGAAATKNCAQCDCDLTGKPRYKSRKGLVFCLPCQEIRRKSPLLKSDGTSNCACCHVSVDPVTCHRNRYRETICEKCRKLGKTATQFRRLLSAVRKKWLSWCLRGAAYLTLGALGVWVFFKILAYATPIPHSE